VRLRRIGVTPITTTIGVVALHNGANPILSVAGALHDLLGGLKISCEHLEDEWRKLLKPRLSMVSIPVCAERL
jgi:hypothetical protein